MYKVRLSVYNFRNKNFQNNQFITSFIVDSRYVFNVFNVFLICYEKPRQVDLAMNEIHF